jgi:hypothetical protein
MKWRAVLDKDTCDKCRILHGTELREDERPPNFYCERENGGCRCVAEPDEVDFKEVEGRIEFGACETCGGGRVVPGNGLRNRDSRYGARRLRTGHEDWLPCPACNGGRT